MKLVHLDAARGLASVIVVFHHYALGFAPHWREAAIGSATGNFWGWTLNGTAAVCFFFVLSGFVLTRRYFEHDDTRILIRGALKRFPRLYLSCAISILLGFTVLNFGLEQTSAAADISGSEWLRAYGFAGLPHDSPFSLFAAIYQSFTVLLIPGNHYFNSNLWTMVFEFWGSIFVFVLAWILMTSSRVSLMIPVGLFGIVFYVVHRYSGLLPSSHIVSLLVPPLMFGCFVALLDARGFRLPRWVAIPLLCLGLYSCSQFSGNWNKLGGALLLLGFLSFHRPPALLAGKVGILLGEISFPLYLVHTIVLLSVGTYVAVGLHSFGVAGLSVDVAILFAIFGASLIPCMAIIYIERKWIPFVNAWAGKALDFYFRTAPGIRRR